VQDALFAGMQRFMDTEIQVEACLVTGCMDFGCRMHCCMDAEIQVEACLVTLMHGFVDAGCIGART
jgi:hypothetical protein